VSRPFVLIVDDDDVIRSLLRSTLPDEGYDVIEAEDGKQALHISETQRPALVLLDWRMPGLSGGDVLAELKRRHPDVPVIVLTAEPEETVRGQAESLGADVFMTKPFSPMRLLDCIESFLPESLPDEAS
jgi:two-component system phosphate regulon response regulator PhoB